jgi:uncharacterized protein
MPAMKDFIIVSAQDLPASSVVLAGGDAVAETDCACPEDGFVFEAAAPPTSETDVYVLPALYTQALAEGFSLAFNPLGRAGVIVLDRAARALLHTFRQPQPLAVGARLAGGSPAGLAAARRLAELGMLDPLGVDRRPPQATARTLTTWLHLTNACNLRCDYCYLHKTAEAMELGRGRQAVDAVFRSAVAHGFRRVKIKYTGGEATLNFALVPALHDYARRLAEGHGLELEGVVLSNGVRMTDQMIAELRTRGLRLMISLDGVGATHDAQRCFAGGRGSFAHVERTLDRLMAHGLRPTISITVSRRNLAGLAETVSYVLDRDLPFALNFYRENECSAAVDLAYGDEQLIAAMKCAFAVIEMRLPSYSLLGALVDRARLDVPHDRPCGVGTSYLVIDQHGGVAKCQMEIGQVVTDVSAADPLRLVREDAIGVQNYAVEEKEGCRECAWRFWCAGGCPALTYRVTGRFDVKSPNCRVYKALFPAVLRLEGLRLLKYSGFLASA